MSEEVIRFGAGGVPYRAPAPEAPKSEKKKKEPEVEVSWSETETPAEELEKLGLKNDENV